MAANNAGCGAGGIQQNTIELLIATPLLREAAIALLDFGFHAQPFQVVIDAGQTLFINIHRHDLRLGATSRICVVFPPGAAQRSRMRSPFFGCR